MLYSMFNLSDSTLSVAPLAPTEDIKKGLAGAAGYLSLADIILAGEMSVLGTFSSQGVRAGWKHTQYIC